MKILIPVLFLFLALTGCQKSKKEQIEKYYELAQTPEGSNSTHEPPNSNQVPSSESYSSTLADASPIQETTIKEGLISGVSISNIRAYKSRSHENAWYVGGELTGRGLDKQFACWLISGDPASPGMIISVDVWAGQYSAFPRRKEITSIADTEYRIVERGF